MLALVIIMIVLGILMAILITKFPKLKIPFQIVLAIAIVVLAYSVYESVMGPVRFNKEKDVRSEKIVQSLKDIRTAQLTYRSVYSDYASDFDSLIYFLQTDSLPFKYIEGNLDSIMDKGISKVQAIKQGLVIEHVSYINIMDTLFNKRADFDIANIGMIPYSDPPKEFTMEKAKITRSNVEIPVFEASALFEDFLSGMDDQLIKNLNKARKDLEQFEGLKVGSLLESSTDGNWE